MSNRHQSCAWHIVGFYPQLIWLYLERGPVKASAVLAPSVLFMALGLAVPASAQTAPSSAPAAAPAAAPADPVAQLVSQLDLGRYKETIRGLARFGDRK